MIELNFSLDFNLAYTLLEKSTMLEIMITPKGN